MMSLERMPSSIATRVRRGRQSTARRRSSLAERRERIGLRAQAYRAWLRPGRGGAEVKLGVHVGYWGLGLTSQDQVEIVQEAERLGYDSVWTAEAYGSGAATILRPPPPPTAQIQTRAAIFQMPGRSPAMAAMTAATLDQLSDGRMLLGIGSSGPQVSEGWHGVRLGKQPQRPQN